MKTLYFDCFSGISGDMTLGALLDIGADGTKLVEDLKKLGIPGYEIRIEQKLKNGIAGTDFTVLLEGELQEHEEHEEHDHVHPGHAHTHSHQENHDHEGHVHEEHAHTHRSYADILEIIGHSGLNDRVKRISREIFAVVAEAEGKIHGRPVQEVHFHEVGAIDSIVDIIGTAICIDMLDVDRIIFSHIPLSRGFVKCQHGIFPLPAPATMEILKDVPVYYNEAGFELVTPTGAAIVKALGNGFGTVDGNISKIGYGLGKKTYDVPNVLRVMLVEEAAASSESIYQIEANIDDMTPEQLGYILGRLMDEGALDAYFTSIYMKKNRPAVKLTVLCSPEKKALLTNTLLLQTSTFGVRYCKKDRTILERETVQLDTAYGKVRCKLGRLEGKTVKCSPEYEDCRSIAEQAGKPITQVYNEILCEAGKLLENK